MISFEDRIEAEYHSADALNEGESVDDLALSNRPPRLPAVNG